MTPTDLTKLRDAAKVCEAHATRAIGRRAADSFAGTFGSGRSITAMQFSILRLLIVTAIVSVWLPVARYIYIEMLVAQPELHPLFVAFSAGFAACCALASPVAVVSVLWLLGGEIEKQIRKVMER